MRRRNTDINIFSMSALDLFACSLGVFVLLTVVFLPFFPNTGDHPAVSEATMQRLSQAEAQVTELGSQLSEQKEENIALRSENDLLVEDNDVLAKNVKTLESDLSFTQENIQILTAALSDVQNINTEQFEQLIARTNSSQTGSLIEFPPVDIVVVLDSTGSMRAQIDGLKAEITNFSKLMRELSPSVGMGVVDYKDRCEQQPVRSFDLVEMDSLTIPRIQAFADLIQPGGAFCNSDGPEALKSALESAVLMDWRDESDVRLIVIITDNSAYPEEEAEALRLAQSFATRGKGYSIGAAQVGADRNTKRFLTQLVDAGGGDLVPGGGSFTTTVLLSLAGL